jgi:hypothetical protein
MMRSASSNTERTAETARSKSVPILAFGIEERSVVNGGFPREAMMIDMDLETFKKKLFRPANECMTLYIY